MDRTTLTIVAISVLLTLLGAAWLVWKFFIDFLKYFVITLVVFVAGAGLYIYRAYTRSAQVSVDPARGKHAYSTQNGTYLGVIEGSGRDSQRGEVWIVRPPGGPPVMYRKSRVTLKDQR
ncbi:MAG TPA: hypothetical protein VJ302_03770 [Blastocatellia bacterium]|nr:hypothetical protein [Blastocatellia bacterium]